MPTARYWQIIAVVNLYFSGVDILAIGSGYSMHWLLVDPIIYRCIIGIYMSNMFITLPFWLELGWVGKLWAEKILDIF